jgi:glucose/arabinose dehydrogenase
LRNPNPSSRTLVASIIVLSVAGLAGLVGFLPTRSGAAEGDVAETWAGTCASCHGAKLTGGQAKSLLDDEWSFGGDDTNLAESIRNGREDAGMPPFGGSLSEEEIRALVIFIREQRKAYERDQTTFAAPEGDTVVESEKHAFRVETVVDGLEIPWSIAFLPDGRMLVTEKAGRLRVVEEGRLAPQPIVGTPEVWSEGQGGLLDVAVHPAYEKTGWVYLSFSDPGKDDTAMTAVVRGRIRDGKWVDEETLFRAPAELYLKGRVHFGSRFVFDGKGYLFFTIGERGHQDHAQDVTRPNGKVHRIHDDGRIPEDNPFADQKGAIPSIWSYGHRNPQGLARDPLTGDLYDAEHGPRGGDELNIVEPGRNYGWPIITYGMNYDGTPITNLTAKEGMEQPVVHWTPSLAVCAIDFYVGDRFPGWRNDLFLSSLAAEELVRLEIEDRKVVHQEVLFKGIGRVRDVVSGPDGYLYVSLEPGRIARLVPAVGAVETR